MLSKAVTKTPAIKKSLKGKENGLIQQKLFTSGGLKQKNEMSVKQKTERIEHKESTIENDPVKLEYSEMGSSWFSRLSKEFEKNYYKDLMKFLASEKAKSKTIYPAEENVYSWSKFTAFEDVKVVIIGQDPYHGPHQAHGLCFSVEKGVATPPSLVNIYNELLRDENVKNFKKPSHGHLVGWATQGVLLLNAVLTVEGGKANSHSGKGWEKLTDAIISLLSKEKKHLVFILWGKYAEKKAAGVDRSKHLILKSVHPSPLSAHRGFIGCGHFSKANEYLKKHGLETIDWSYLP
ncbi:hypothetical protein MP638_004454 [Amoeboaphelidium occidentale]|nr:hypothetical protein MP638_004454 [Amoeboaphelidium occidentale]